MLACLLASSSAKSSLLRNDCSSQLDDRQGAILSGCREVEVKIKFESKAKHFRRSEMAIGIMMQPHAPPSIQKLKIGIHVWRPPVVASHSTMEQPMLCSRFHQRDSAPRFKSTTRVPNKTLTLITCLPRRRAWHILITSPINTSVNHNILQLCFCGTVFLLSFPHLRTTVRALLGRVKYHVYQNYIGHYSSVSNHPT